MMDIRGGAPLLQGVASFAGLVWESRLGAKLLRPARYLWGSHCSRRGAAPTRASVVCWVGVGAPPRGEALGLRSGLWGSHCSRRGAAPTRAVAFAGLVWESRLGAKLLRPARYLWGSHCSRRGAAPTGGRVVCWAGVGAPPRGEAVEAGSIFVGQPLFAAGRRSYRGSRRLLGWCGSPASGRSC
jgi:hypothetical protein